MFPVLFTDSYWPAFYNITCTNLILLLISLRLSPWNYFKWLAPIRARALLGLMGGVASAQRPPTEAAFASSKLDEERFDETASGTIEDARINARPLWLDAGQRHPRLAPRAKALLDRHWLGNSAGMKFRHWSLPWIRRERGRVSQSPTPVVVPSWPVMANCAPSVR